MNPNTSTCLAKLTLPRILATGIILTIITRLPQFLGGHLVPDGDECVVGLMAKHLLDGSNLPLFFYGQRYGFSFVEAWTAATFFYAAGISATALKAAMLLLWALGWVFVVLSVRNFQGMRAAAIAGLLLIVCPAWSIWSMKARGGYLTAFALTQLLVWIVSTESREVRVRPRPGALAAIGACLALVFFSQPLWLFTAAPFIALFFNKRRRLQDLWPIGAGLALCAIPLLIVRESIQTVAWQTYTFNYINPVAMVQTLPFNLWVQFSGASPFSDYYEAGPATDIAATFWSILLALACFDFARRLTRRQYLSPFQAAIWACLANIGFCVFINVFQFGYRYLLPLNAFLVIALSIRFDQMLDGPRRKLTLCTIAAVTIAGSISLLEAGTVPSVVRVQPEQQANISDEVALREMVRRLDQEGIQNVYCFHSTFFWNIIFASEERINARWMQPGGRRLEYGNAVDVALLSGEPTAIIGEIGILPELKRFLASQGYARPKIIVIEDAFFLLVNPPPRMVTQLGFILNDPKHLEELLRNKHLK